MDSIAQAPLYKVLVNGSSCHGGSLAWPLPTQNESGEWIPGAWVALGNKRKLILCENALHLTDQPASWYLPDAQCWLAEYRGESVGELSVDWESKLGVREARLLRPVAWEDVAVWSSGDHTLRTGVGRASGSATVRAYDSATVRAYGSATVRAYDSATVEASGSATVEASGSATVRAYGSATVISTTWHSHSAQVALSQMAAHVDRRGGKVVCRVAEAAS